MASNSESINFFLGVLSEYAIANECILLTSLSIVGTDNQRIVSMEILIEFEPDQIVKVENTFLKGRLLV